MATQAHHTTCGVARRYIRRPSGRMRPTETGKAVLACSFGADKAADAPRSGNGLPLRREAERRSIHNKPGLQPPSSGYGQATGEYPANNGPASVTPPTDWRTTWTDPTQSAGLASAIIESASWLPPIAVSAVAAITLTPTAMHRSSTSNIGWWMSNSSTDPGSRVPSRNKLPGIDSRYQAKSSPPRLCGAGVIAGGPSTRSAAAAIIPVLTASFTAGGTLRS